MPPPQVVTPLPPWSIIQPAKILAPSVCLNQDRKSTRLNSSHTEIYTLSLHDALPICIDVVSYATASSSYATTTLVDNSAGKDPSTLSLFKSRSEEHTSELQSHRDLHSFPTRRSSDLHRRCKLCHRLK